VHFLTADKIFDGQNFLTSNPVLVLNDKQELVEIVAANIIDKSKVEKFEGVLSPGFVNAHCHTELSHLKNHIPQKTGLPGFGKHIIGKRVTFHEEEIKEHIADADKEMFNNGIVVVGDICNTNHSFEMKARSKIFYHSFIELLGLKPERATESFKSGINLIGELTKYNLAGSLAPHAPYSTSKELIKKIAVYNTQQNLSSSIHNQESEEETKFFMGIKGGFNELYDFLQMDLSWFIPPKTSSLQYYSEAWEDQKTILIHNTFTTKEDIEFVKNKNIYWCFCPNANKYIEDRLPDFNLFSSFKNIICLGTDSLASNTQLDLVNEANRVLSNSDLEIEDLLKSMTYIAADALNISNNFGSFIVGKNTGINLIEFKNDQIQFIKKIT